MSFEIFLLGRNPCCTHVVICNPTVDILLNFGRKKPFVEQKKKCGLMQKMKNRIKGC